MTEPSTSQAVEDDKKEENKEDDVKALDPFIDFTCGICGLHEKTLFGELKVSDGSYPAPVYFIRDPFVPPPRVKARRPVLSDYMVMGSTCSMCDQPICFTQTCSVFFGAHFCTNCICRERRKFPAEVLEIVTKAQSRTQQQQQQATTSK